MCNEKHTIKASCYTKRGMLIASRYNSYTKTHPLQDYFARKVGHPEKKYLHAEVAAILACKDKKIYSIFIERYNRLGKPMLAKPCCICQAVIAVFNIKKVRYTYNDCC